MKHIIKTVLGVLAAAALLATTSAFAQTNSDLWSLSVGGTGTIGVPSHAGETISARLGLEVGHKDYIFSPGEFGVRQSIGYSSALQANNQWGFNTKLYQDWRIVRAGNLELDLGGNVGATYGNTPLALTVSPEATARLWLLKNVNTFVRAEYPFQWNSENIRQQRQIPLTAALQFTF